TSDWAQQDEEEGGDASASVDRRRRFPIATGRSKALRRKLGLQLEIAEDRIDTAVAEEVMEAGCITADQINGLVCLWYDLQGRNKLRKARPSLQA
ncbi:unnamed protein product, partial [Thlaspi arvense]